MEMAVRWEMAVRREIAYRVRDLIVCEVRRVRPVRDVLVLVPRVPVAPDAQVDVGGHVQKML